MSLTYTTYVATLANMLEVPAADTDFVQVLPSCIDYAELRLYRELDLVANTTRNTTYSLTTGSRNLTIPVGTFVVINNINVITPAGTTNPELGSRVPLTPTSWDFLDAVYGSSSTDIPKYFALQDTATIAVGPWPNGNYQAEIIGAIRPAPLASGNPTTTLSTYFPDLLVSASMIFMSGYTKNFGAMMDDPKMAQTWEAVLQTQMGSAATEEAKKRMISAPAVKMS